MSHSGALAVSYLPPSKHVEAEVRLIWAVTDCLAVLGEAHVDTICTLRCDGGVLALTGQERLCFCIPSSGLQQAEEHLCICGS
jgi:hypothetical protein